MFLDQVVASFCLLLPSLKRARCDRLKRIQIIDINAIHLVDCGIDVSGHGKVNDEKWPVAPHPEDRLELRPRDNCMRRSSATDQDVQIPKLFFPMIKTDGTTTYGFGQFRRSLERTIRDKQLPDSVRLKTPSCSLARLARTQDHNFMSPKFPENLSSQIHGHRTDGNTATSYRSCRSYMLADMECLLEKSVQDSARRPRPRRCLIGSFNLPKNFRFAQNHRFEPGGNPKQMTDRGNSL